MFSSFRFFVHQVWICDDGDSRVLGSLKPPQLRPDGLNERSSGVPRVCCCGWWRWPEEQQLSDHAVVSSCHTRTDLPGLAPSDQQVLARGPAWSSSVDSVLPGRSWPWWRCLLPAARPSQFLCLLENIRSALQRGSVADHGLTGAPAPALSTSSLTWLTLPTLSQITTLRITRTTYSAETLSRLKM